VGKQGMFRGTLDGGQRVVGIQKLKHTLVAQFHDYFFDQTLVARDLYVLHFFGAEPSKEKGQKKGGIFTTIFTTPRIQKWKRDDGQGEQRVSATGSVDENNGPQGRSKHKQHNVPHGKDVEEVYAAVVTE
jgi:hypothetical protein